MSESRKRFTDLLKTIFELDKSDLDFGIYRIMNIRRKEIIDFFEKALPQRIEETLAPFARGNSEKIKTQMKQIEENALAMGMTIEALSESAPMRVQYKELKKQLAEGVDLSALESDVYSALFSFFNRYYDEGDFISKRRYKEGVYALPYEGEEVKLYWANQDQYYIKTSENFKDYTFQADDATVHFRLVDATTEQNNNKESEKEKRTFMLYSETAEQPDLHTFEYDAEKKELVIRFVYDIPEDKKHKYAEENLKAIIDYLVKEQRELIPSLMRNTSSDPKKNIPLIEKHLKGYVAKNSFDYFIHKDLGGFLQRELDFYIKNEIMHLDDLDTENEARVETYLAKVRAIKRVGSVIIDFLAQIEDFQKKLWLKKKFVVETNWCLTLDRIDEAFYPEILANQAQVKEWVEMYAIDEIKGDNATIGYSEALSIDFLRQNPHLVVDTKHFSTDFRDRLVATINNLDEETNGVMFNGDNFHVLTLLQERYKNAIDCCYYDPPYNTSEGSFIYKNGYKESSWATMMFDRLNSSRDLMKSSAILCTAIDDFEHPLLEYVSDNVFGRNCRLGNLVVEIKPSGRTNDYFLATSHEYIIFYTKVYSEASICFSPLTKEQLAQYKEDSEHGAHKWRDFMRTGGYSTPEERPNSFYPIFFNEETGDIALEESPDYIKILPIDSVGKYRVWRKTIPSLLTHLEANEIKIAKNRDGSDYKVQIIDKVKEGVRPKSVWVGSKYDSSSHGTKLLKAMFGETSPFSFPKSIHAVYDTLYAVAGEHSNSIILDIFAGSATTAEAVIRLNKNIDEEGKEGTRKFILAEMGDYFTTVTQPRIKKVIYSADWKDGKPVNRTTGVSHIMKYMRLESYEDTLSNIELKKMESMDSLFGDEYIVKYMLNMEAKGSLLNLDAFYTPFNYEMRITEKNECKQRIIDVCETFNYLIGIAVQSQTAISYFNVTKATTPTYEGAKDLLKNKDGKYGFRQIEGTLRDGRRALIIWRSIDKDNILESNAALDAYFTKYRINPQDREYDVIFVNGDNNLENLRLDPEQWKVIRTEEEFNKRMWEE